MGGGERALGNKAAANAAPRLTHAMAAFSPTESSGPNTAPAASTDINDGPSTDGLLALYLAGSSSHSLTSAPHAPALSLICILSEPLYHLLSLQAVHNRLVTTSSTCPLPLVSLHLFIQTTGHRRLFRRSRCAGAAAAAAAAAGAVRVRFWGASSG